MADKDKGEEEEKKGKGKVLIIVLAVALVVAIAGGSAAGAVALTLANAPATAEEEEEPADEPHAVGPLMEVPAMVVNLDDPTGSHFIRAGFQFELVDAERQADVEAHLVPVRSAILLHLSGLTVEEAMGRENREALLVRLLEIANEQIGAELVTNIYFTALVVQ